MSTSATLAVNTNAVEPPVDFDIAICGAGPVGLTLAALLVQRGVPAARIILLDAKKLADVTVDPRSIAISYGSRQILERVGAWPIAAQAIEQIHVSRRGNFGRTLIEHTDYGVPALGYVTRYGAVVSALDRAVAATGIRVQRPARIERVTETPHAVTLIIDDGSVVRTALLIQAEGGVFAEQPARLRHHDYQQSAIVGHVTTSQRQPHRAYERFTAEGPLALLPQDDGYALVWCARTASAERLMALPDSAFLAELGEMFGERVGRFNTIGARFAYPLGLNAQVAPTARTIAIGNAAQTLHPVAGQGLNLGLRDASVLARLLASDAAPGALVAFSQQRRVDRSLAIGLTDTMARIFASAPDGALSQSLLGFSLGLVDVVPPLKHALAAQMMFGRR